MAPKPDPVQLVCEICERFPESVLKPMGGHEAPAFRVRDKMFVKVNEDLSGFICKAPPGAREVLVASEPERFYVPSYMGHTTWIGVRFVDVDRNELAAIIEDSYRLIAPKKLVAMLEQG